MLGMRILPGRRISSFLRHLTSITSSPHHVPLADPSLFPVVDLLPRPNKHDADRNEKETGRSDVSASNAVPGPSGYQYLFELASREGVPDAHLRMKALLDESKEKGHFLTPESCSLLARCFGRAGMISDALHVFRGLDPSLRKAEICKDILRLLLGSGDSNYRREAFAIVRDMIRNDDPSCQLDENSSSMIFSALGKKTQPMDSDACDLAIEVVEFGLFPSNEIQFSQLVDRACRSGFVSKAWNFLHAVKNKGGVVVTNPCNALLTGLGRVRDFKRMNSLFSEMKEWGAQPDKFTYGILLNHLSKSRRVDEALKVFDEMLVPRESSASAVVPDAVLCNIVIDGLCKEDRLEEGLAFLDSMKNNHQCSPNTVTHNSLIGGFCKIGEIDKAIQLLKRMKNEGVPANVVTMNTLIDGMCRRGRMSSALALVYDSQFSVDGVRGNTVTYSILIGAFLHANNVSKAMELFDEMLKGGNTPDGITYYTLISGLCQVGRLDQASSVATQMQKDGFPLDTRCYNILINGFCKKKKLDKARELLDEMVQRGHQPDQVTFNTLISASSNVGDFSTCQVLLSKMVNSGHKPSVITYGALIHGYCKVGNIDDAMKIFRTMIKAGVSPSTVIYNILIEYFSKRSDINEVLSLMEKMQSQRVQLSTATYNSVFRCLQDRNLVDEACEVMSKMKEQGCNPDYITLEILTEWFSAVGEIAKLQTFVQGNTVAN